MAVLTLGAAGEILSARGDCPGVFGWEGSVLVGQNVGGMLQDSLDNELGRFLERRRAGKSSETVLLRVIILKRDGTQFTASVTTPTWSSNSQLTHGSQGAPFGWTVAFRAWTGGTESETEQEPASTTTTSPVAATTGPAPCPVTPGPLTPPTPAPAPPPAPLPSVVRPGPPRAEAKPGPDPSTAPSTGSGQAAVRTPADPLTELQVRCAQLNERLATEQQAAAGWRREAEDLRGRVGLNAAEQARVQANLEKQNVERERSESEWRQQLDTVAQALTHKLEAAGTEAMRRTQQLTEELESLRQERDQLKDSLAAAQQAAAESAQRRDEFEAQLRKAVSDLEIARARPELSADEKSRPEFELRAQLDTAKEAAGYAEAAFKEEARRNKELEARLHSLDNLNLEQTQKNTRLAEEVASLRREQDELKNRLETEQLAVTQSTQRQAELENQLRKAETDLQAAQQNADRRTADEAARLQQERDELKDKLAAEQRAAAGSKQQVAELESLLAKNHAGLERAKTDHEKQSAEHARGETQWREQLENAKAEKKELETAGAKAMERNAQLEAKLAGLRREHSELKGRLAAEELAVIDAKHQAAELQTRQDQDTAELELLKTDLERQSAEHTRAETHWREQLAAAKAQRKELETAWAGVMDRHMHAEEELTTLRRAHDELRAQLTAEESAVADAKRQVEELLGRLDLNAAIAPELEQLKAELEEQRAEFERSETQWREQLEAAQAQTKDIEATWAQAMDQTMQTEQELSGLRQAHDELLARFAAEEQATADAKREAIELQSRLQADAGVEAELARVQTDLQEQQTQRECAEAELRQQLEEAKAQRKEIEAAWTAAVERNMRVEEELAGLWQEQDSLNAKLKAEQQAATDAKRRADDLDSRLRRNTAELTRAKTDLEKQHAELDRAESNEREQLDTAKALTKKLETAWAGAVERNKRVEAELAVLRQQRDELNSQLSAARLAAAEARKRADVQEARLQQAVAELDRGKALRTKPGSEHAHTEPVQLRPRTVTRHLPTQPLRTRVEPIVRAETPLPRQGSTEELLPQTPPQLGRYNLKP